MLDIIIKTVSSFFKKMTIEMKLYYCYNNNGEYLILIFRSNLYEFAYES